MGTGGLKIDAMVVLTRPTFGIGLACIVGASSVTTAGPADAQTVEQFYRGKSITLQIGSTPGGGYDTYARLFARYFTRYMPGNPTVLPQNIPGAGSLKLANDLYNIAPRDGSVIGSIGKEQVTAPLFGVSGVRFDALKVNWLGTLDRGPASAPPGIHPVSDPWIRHARPRWCSAAPDRHPSRSSCRRHCGKSLVIN